MIIVADAGDSPRAWAPHALLTNTTVLTINLIHLQDVGVDHARAAGQSCRSLEQYLPFAVPSSGLCS